MALEALTTRKAQLEAELAKVEKSVSAGRVKVKSLRVPYLVRKGNPADMACTGI